MGISGEFTNPRLQKLEHAATKESKNWCKIAGREPPCFQFPRQGLVEKVLWIFHCGSRNFHCGLRNAWGRLVPSLPDDPPAEDDRQTARHHAEAGRAVGEESGPSGRSFLE